MVFLPISGQKSMKSGSKGESKKGGQKRGQKGDQKRGQKSTKTEGPKSAIFDQILMCRWGGGNRFF
jgi:hypothetical protein